MFGRNGLVPADASLESPSARFFQHIVEGSSTFCGAHPVDLNDDEL